MKKNAIIVLMVLIISGYGLAKSKMDPQMQEQLIRELNEMPYGVLIMEHIPASRDLPCHVYVKDAGEAEMIWEQKKMFGIAPRDNCNSHFNPGDLIKLYKVKPEKWGFSIGIQSDNSVKKSTPSPTKGSKLDFMFHKKRYDNTPENIQFIRNTLSKVFKRFKSQLEAMVYIDKEILDYTVEVGMTIEQVVEKFGEPKDKRQSESQLIYDYEIWSIIFEEEKVVDVVF